MFKVFIDGEAGTIRSRAREEAPIRGALIEEFVLETHLDATGNAGHPP